eukprot:TRINITY_DN3320_c0_g1_i5.p1 TRINITY_DN3320_c0_g1~~TRINITY_DN3320_c0_g1_i5.p1  ORF type:complete len:213 (-),score=55.45 TRINITY_DN3320_c0_g1_i5:178-816(-)
MQTFAEHTKAIHAVKWNPNNQDEFASVSEDMLLKIWDRRSETSVNTMLDREDGHALYCCDWNKQDDWTIAVGSINKKVYIWDTRNPLVPVKQREAHKMSVQDVKFDTTSANRLLTGSADRVTRVWDVSQGIYLTHEHRLHEGTVTAVDWDVFSPGMITSASSDKSVIAVALDAIQQVTEVEQQGQLRTAKHWKQPPLVVTPREADSQAMARL